jgi:peroxin-2
LQVRRFVLQLLPKLPMIGGGSSMAGSASSLQYPVAALSQPQKPSAAAAPTHGGGANDSQQVQQARMTGSSSSSGGGGGSSLQELLKPLGPCPICSTSDILLPFVAHPCRHIFCYYCLQSQCAADSDFACPVDGVRVDALQRYVRVVNLPGD